jgi:hypothetical protein
VQLCHRHTAAAHMQAILPQLPHLTALSIKDCELEGVFVGEGPAGAADAEVAVAQALLARMLGGASRPHLKELTLCWTDLPQELPGGCLPALSKLQFFEGGELTSGITSGDVLPPSWCRGLPSLRCLWLTG